MTQPSESSKPRSLKSPAILAVILLALFLICSICTHRFNLNDEKYFRWSWRSNIAAFPLYPAAIACAIPFFLGQWLFSRHPKSLWLPLSLVTASMFALMFTCTLLQPRPAAPGNRITDIILNPTDSGYFTDAQRLFRAGCSARRLLADYPQLQPQLAGHTRLKPPGPLLFDLLLIQHFGNSLATAQLSAILIALMAALAVPATCLFILHFTKQPGAAFLGASYLALCPSLLFFPQFDQCYVPLTFGLTVLWSRALQTRRPQYAIAFGLFAALTTFITYLPLVLIFFLAAFTLFEIPNLKSQILSPIAIALTAFLAFYFLLWLATAFNPIATFRQALHLQHQALARWQSNVGYPDRRLPGTIPWDLYSFALGTGWISYLLAAYFCTGQIKRANPQLLKIALLCIAQLTFVAVTGIIQSETARVWIFMQPLLMLPIGLELATWSPRPRAIVYAALLLLTAAMCQNLVFAV